MKNNEMMNFKAYQYIKNKITTGQYAPSTDIDEQKIKNELSMSRTPIREALIQLKLEGLIEIYPQKGIFVAPITLKMINDMFQMRYFIEPSIFEFYGSNIDVAKLQQFRKIFESLPDNLNSKQLNDYYIKMDNDFHLFVISSCNNEQLNKIMGNIFDQTQRIRYKLYNTVIERYAISKQEHLLVINATLQNQFEDAGKYMRQHIISSRNVALSINNIVSDVFL